MNGLLLYKAIKTEQGVQPYTLGVSLDDLTGKDDVHTDKDTSICILKVSKFEETDRNHIFSVIDAFIAKRKIQSIL